MIHHSILSSSSLPTTPTSASSSVAIKKNRTQPVNQCNTYVISIASIPWIQKKIGGYQSEQFRAVSTLFLFVGTCKKHVNHAPCINEKKTKTLTVWKNWSSNSTAWNRKKIYFRVIGDRKIYMSWNFIYFFENIPLLFTLFDKERNDNFTNEWRSARFPRGQLRNQSMTNSSQDKIENWKTLNLNWCEKNHVLHSSCSYCVENCLFTPTLLTRIVHIFFRVFILSFSSIWFY